MFFYGAVRLLEPSFPKGTPQGLIKFYLSFYLEEKMEIIPGKVTNINIMVIE